MSIGLKQVPKPTAGLPFEVAVVVSFGFFIPKRVLSEFPLGTINVHPSLLPW